MHDRKERVRVIERLATIDEMNHHIRNALQIISFNAHGESSETELAEIRQAVTRIQWSLNEILPKVEPEFAPFDRSAAHGQYEDPEDHG
jgi:two-component sensor histidine kinase